MAVNGFNRLSGLKPRPVDSEENQVKFRSASDSDISNLVNSVLRKDQVEIYNDNKRNIKPINKTFTRVLNNFSQSKNQDNSIFVNKARKTIIMNEKSRQKAEVALEAGDYFLTVYDPKTGQEVRKIDLREYEIIVVTKKQMQEINFRLNLIFSQNSDDIKKMSKNKEEYTSDISRRGFYQSTTISFPPSLEAKDVAKRILLLIKFQHQWIIGQFIWDKRLEAKRKEILIEILTGKLTEQRLLETIKDSQEQVQQQHYWINHSISPVFLTSQSG